MSDKAAKRKRRLGRWLESLGLDNLKVLLEKYPTINVNKQFSRLETPSSHFYIKHWPPGAPNATTRFTGRLKCKLMHGRGWTVIVPDQIHLLQKTDWRWIQPLAFGPNWCVNAEADSACQLQIDISAGESIKVRFMGTPPIRAFEDGSHLYECEIFGPQDLLAHTTGEAYFDAQTIPYLHLYHHTTSAICPLIYSSGYFRSSDWNIQGTTKRLVNIAYAYFTPLSSIKTSDDLKKIAMSQDAKIYLCRDGAQISEPLLPGEAAKYPNDILELEVYRSEPQKRDAAISVWVDATTLAPQHIYRHKIGNDPEYYEIPHEFIQRVGVNHGATVPFDPDGRIHRKPTFKNFDYAVVGDCTSLDGLAAPYDEENTSEVLKVERVNGNQSFVTFWFANANTDLYSGNNPEMQQFRT